MSYTIAQMSELSGVTPRALRHYEDLGLLVPQRTSAQYRIYNTADVDTLQQILFYRELGFPLEEIKRIVLDPKFDGIKALRQHLGALENKKLQLDHLITTVVHTIEEREGTRVMSNGEKFESFKNAALEKNEELFGSEVRANYGKDAATASNKKWMDMSENQHRAMEALSTEILADLKAAVLSRSEPSSEDGISIAKKHREWLGFTWPSYSPEAHKGLGEMYMSDARFTTFYDSEVAGCAAYLRDAIATYVETIR